MGNSCGSNTVEERTAVDDVLCTLSHPQMCAVSLHHSGGAVQDQSQQFLGQASDREEYGWL